MTDAADVLTCPRCGAEAIIPDARVLDRGDADTTKTLQVGVMRNPEALMFKGEEKMNLRAQVCGECGFTELYAVDPARLWGAYLDRLQRIWDRGPEG